MRGTLRLKDWPQIHKPRIESWRPTGPDPSQDPMEGGWSLTTPGDGKSNKQHHMD